MVEKSECKIEWLRKVNDKNKNSWKKWIWKIMVDKSEKTSRKVNVKTDWLKKKMVEKSECKKEWLKICMWKRMVEKSECKKNS